MRAMRHYIGIDPGLNGAIAVLSGAGSLVLLEDTPTVTETKKRKTRKEYVCYAMADLLSRAAAASQSCYAVIEHVHAMPRQGVTSMFRLGYGYGLWIGLLTDRQIPFTRVLPAYWQRDVFAGMSRSLGKKRSVIRCGELYPQFSGCVAGKDGRADALLLARHAMVALEGQNQ